MADFWEPAPAATPCRRQRPDGVRCAINAGPDRAGTTRLQPGTSRRGEQDIDDADRLRTLWAASALADALTLLDSLAAMQRISYRQMAAFGLFGDDWLARLDRRRAKALELMAMEEPVSRR